MHEHSRTRDQIVTPSPVRFASATHHIPLLVFFEVLLVCQVSRLPFVHAGCIHVTAPWDRVFSAKDDAIRLAYDDRFEVAVFSTS